MKIGAVSSFRVACGVGKFWEELAYELSNLVDLKTYAEVVHSGNEQSPPIYPDKPLNYMRNWKRGEPFDFLYEDIINDLPDLVHFQFESALYNEHMYNQSLFLQLLDKLHKAEIPTVITLHNVPQFSAAALYSGWYKKCNSHFIVTNQLMERELRKWEPTVKVTTIPLGSTIFIPTPTMEARQQLGLPEMKYYIISPGFYGMDKGILPLIQSLPKILEVIPCAVLILAGSIHPLAPPIHKFYLIECMKIAYQLGLQDKVIFTGKFLSEQELSLYLSAADTVAINHQYIFGLFSSSASAHRALSCGKPLLLNKDDVRLSEFKDGVHCLKNSNDNIADQVFKLYSDKTLRDKLISGASYYAMQTSYKEIAKTHLKVYENV